MPAMKCSQKRSQYKTGVNYPKKQVETHIMEEGGRLYNPYIYRVCEFLKQNQQIKSHFGVTTVMTTL